VLAQLLVSRLLFVRRNNDYESVYIDTVLFKPIYGTRVCIVRPVSVLTLAQLSKNVSYIAFLRSNDENTLNARRGLVHLPHFSPIRYLK